MNIKKETRGKILKNLGFVFIEGGEVKMGTDKPLICKIEGFRKNETPVRVKKVKPFWICRFLVSNIQFEEFIPNHFRPNTSNRDLDPVTDVTYGEVLSYVKYLSQKHGIKFDLPEEKEWVFAASPFGWEYVYHEDSEPDPTKSYFFHPEHYHTLKVNEDSFGENFKGLFLMGSNVIEMTKNVYKAKGHRGSKIDGSYYLGKGGGFGHCKMASGSVNRRVIVDIATRSTRIGFRLVARHS